MRRARALAEALQPAATHHGAFDPEAVTAYPEPARRWLTHAIEPGVQLVDAVELRMLGGIRLGRRWMRFTAVEALVPDSGFVWAARTRVARLPLSGYDAFVAGAGSMRWRLLGLPVVSADGPDVTRSAAGRLAGESVLVPTSLVHRTWEPAAEPDSAAYLHTAPGGSVESRVTIRVASDGALLGASLRRWGDPDGKGFAEHGFEVNFAAEHALSGITLPDDMRAYWVDAQGGREEFFHAVLDSVEFYTG